ncbi:MAG: DUF177 domain-containing protein [Vicinamibacterales bacterium]
MLLELTHIRQAETGADRTLPADAFAGRDNVFRVTAPVDLRLTVHKDENRYRLVGRVRASLELGCSRCLEPFAFEVNAPFDLRYLPQAEGAGAGERELGDDDLTAAYYSDETIDLGQLVEEQCYLALPMKPLCRPDCKGLCPQCGTNLNVETCGCEAHWEDPRLAGLKALITDRKNDDA